MKRHIKTIVYTVLLVTLLKAEQVSAQLHVQAGAVDAEQKNVGSPVLDGPPVLRIDGYFVWGGSVVPGDDGKYHMFFSLWESGPDKDPFAKSWVLESKIGYAVSDFPDREFKFKKIILKGARYEGNYDAWDAQLVHNPHVKKFDDTYYLYYVGGKDVGEAAAPDLDTRARVQQSLQIGVIQFSSFQALLEGEFQRPETPLLSPRTRVKEKHVLNPSPVGTVAKPDNLIVVNPSVTFNPATGEYLLFFKGNIYEPNWKGVHGVAVASTPAGPFTPRDEFIFDVRMPDGSLANTEDPYVWYSSDYGQFFAIVKDFTGRLTQSGPKTIALLQSQDGIIWKVSDQPLFKDREIRLASGQLVKLDRLERPQLLLSKGGVPFVLYCAASVSNVNQKTDGSSFNIQIPLQYSVRN